MLLESFGYSPSVTLNNAGFCHYFMLTVINFQLSIRGCCLVYLNVKKTNTELIEFCLKNCKFRPILFQIRCNRGIEQ